MYSKVNQLYTYIVLFGRQVMSDSLRPHGLQHVRLPCSSHIRIYIHVYTHIHIHIYIYIYMGFPGGSDDEESACNVEDLGSIPRLGRSPGEGHGNLLQQSCLGNPHGQRRLTGYSPWGHKESDTTEWLSIAQHVCVCRYIYTHTYVSALL